MCIRDSGGGESALRQVSVIVMLLVTMGSWHSFTNFARNRCKEDRNKVPFLSVPLLLQWECGHWLIIMLLLALLEGCVWTFAGGFSFASPPWHSMLLQGFILFSVIAWSGHSKGASDLKQKGAPPFFRYLYDWRRRLRLVFPGLGVISDMAYTLAILLVMLVLVYIGSSMTLPVTEAVFDSTEVVLESTSTSPDAPDQQSYHGILHLMFPLLKIGLRNGWSLFRFGIL